MKKTKMVFLGVLAAVFAMAFTACPTSADTSDITWTATPHNSGQVSVADIHGGGWRSETRSISLTFSRDPGALTASDIAITAGSGSATGGSLSGNGTNRTLTVSGVTAGTVSVAINREGIENEARPVTLSGRPLDITWTATPVGDPGTTEISFTFSASVGTQHLDAADFTITPETGSATMGTLSGNGATRTLAVSGVNAGTVSVAIDRAGIESEPQMVTLATLPLLTGTVSIIGTPDVGQTLTANTDELEGSGDISFQWRRGTTNIGTNSSTYVVQNADADSAITVIITRAGNSGSITSGPIAVLPLLTGTVSITGTPDVGQTLTANTNNLGGSGASVFSGGVGQPISARTAVHTLCRMTMQVRPSL